MKIWKSDGREVKALAMGKDNQWVFLFRCLSWLNQDALIVQASYKRKHTNIMFMNKKPDAYCPGEYQATGVVKYNLLTFQF